MAMLAKILSKVVLVGMLIYLLPRAATRRREEVTTYDFKVSELIAGLDCNDTSGNCDPPPASCPDSKYRSFDGSCNNLRNRGWGTPNSIYGRLTKSKYGDGIFSFPKAVSGNDLPNPRSVSLIFFPDVQLYDFSFTLITQQWGQIMTHDISFTGSVSQTGANPIKCCINGQLAQNASSQPLCAPIIAPRGDPYRKAGTCREFIRTLTTLLLKCGPPNKPADQITEVSAQLDASIIYGSSEDENMQLRTLKGGQMKTAERNNQVWLPQSTNVAEDCPLAATPTEPCYHAGDSRVNQSPQLAMLQVILVREHNRIAVGLSSINPHWNDESIFQTARRIVIARLQWIHYYEYLPLVIGKENMVYNKLIYTDVEGYVDDYNTAINPAPLNEYATAAFRFFHTMIRGFLQLVYESRTIAGQIRLSNWYDRPVIIEQGDNFNGLVRGISYQQSAGSDKYFDSEITQFLFRGNNTFGGDLRAIDIQRGRDHGLGSYLSARAACGLSVPRSYNEMLNYMSRQNVRKLKQTYENLEDIDLAVGGALEILVPQTRVGPTFLCIITKQFYRTRTSDRFFFENGANRKTAFSLPQLNSIRKGSSMARLLCDNSGVSTMQRNAFKRVDIQNPAIPCQQIPTIDLSLWKDSN